MGKKTVRKKNDVLAKAIIKAIKQHKGKEVVSLDLRGIETAVCDLLFAMAHQARILPLLLKMFEKMYRNY